MYPILQRSKIFGPSEAGVNMDTIKLTVKNWPNYNLSCNYLFLCVPNILFSLLKHGDWCDRRYIIKAEQADETKTDNKIL